MEKIANEEKIFRFLKMQDAELAQQEDAYFYTNMIKVKVGNDIVEWLKNVPQHPCDRQAALGVKYNKVIWNLPPETDEYYIQQVLGSLTMAFKKESSTKKINISSYNNGEEEVQVTNKNLSIQEIVVG